MTEIKFFMFGALHFTKFFRDVGDSALKKFF
jgi:hypothetical protein